MLAYDRRKSAYSAVPLPFTSKDFVVKLVDKDEASYEVVGRSFPPHLGWIGNLGYGLGSLLNPIFRMPFADMSVGAFYELILVSDFVTNYLRRDLTMPLSYQDQIKVKRTLKGLRVELNHTECVKHYKISGMSIVPEK
ncbi:argonaute 5 [Olea europaea subsp. europaea]|uniref:Argonaute 5 n=1 Tax=Olea europaea subsp. europaea TaxID=158383 RepID=A0A8S0TF92_OLEEU|nr:argonaute 5 [Olea europaea subsp. europaea]